MEAKAMFYYQTSDHTYGQDVVVTKVNPDHIEDMLEAFRAYLKAIGYDFVEKVIVTSGEKEWSTL